MMPRQQHADLLVKFAMKNRFLSEPVRVEREAAAGTLADAVVKSVAARAGLD